MALKNRRTQIINTPVDCLDLHNTVETIIDHILSDTQVHVAFVNAALTVMMEDDADLKRYISKADIISADGMSIVYASRLLGGDIPERVTGPDLMDDVMARAAEFGLRAFLFGARDDVVESVARHYRDRYGSDVIAGYRNGYFKREEEATIAGSINSSSADMLFLALPSPMKERFCYQHRNKMPNVRLLMGVGGAFDVISGKIPRAPQWMQDAGLEWFYRFKNEPRRLWKRYLLGNPRFLSLLARELMSGQKRKSGFVET